MSEFLYIMSLSMLDFWYAYILTIGQPNVPVDNLLQAEG